MGGGVVVVEAGQSGKKTKKEGKGENKTANQQKHSS